MAMRQPLICHCNFLDPGSVGASTLGLPSLVVIFNVIEEKMFLSCSDLFAKLLLSRLPFFASPPRSDLSFCRGFKKVLLEASPETLTFDAF